MNNCRTHGVSGRYFSYCGWGVIADHYRRWWWVQALAALYALGFGWSLASPNGDGEYWHGHHIFLLAWIKSMSLMFASGLFCLSVFSGAMLLLFDLQRGLARVAATLPLTSRQLGRSWWLATVAVPAGVDIALLFAGAGVFYYSHPHAAFSLGRLALAGWVTFLWFGMNFLTYFMQYTQKSGRNGRERAFDFLTTVLIIWLLFGFSFSLNRQKDPYQWAIFLLIGSLLTVVGWMRSGQFNVQAKPVKPVVPWHFPHVRGHLGGKDRLTPLHVGNETKRRSAASGRCGIPLLIADTFRNTFLFCLALAVWMPLACKWMGLIKSWPDLITLAAGLAPAYGCIVFLCLMPVVRQLRFLRSLPIPANRLSLVFMALAILPLLTLGALLAGIAWLSTDSSVTFQVLKEFAFVLAPTSLCIFIALWRGTGITAYAALIFIFIGFQCELHWLISTGLESIGIIAAVGITLAYLAIHYTLRRSSHAYRVPTVPLECVK